MIFYEITNILLPVEGSVAVFTDDKNSIVFNLDAI